MGNRIVVGLASVFVIGILTVGAVIAAFIAWEPFGNNRSFGEITLIDQVITVGVIPAIVVLAGVLPWWLGDFSFAQSLGLSVVVHAVSIGIGVSTQEPVMLLIALVVGWIVVPVALSSDA
jgi:hypothetical protein